MHTVSCEVALWVRSKVADRILSQARAFAPYETGGLLIGYTSPSAQDIVIVDLVGPGPNAIHERARFEPDYDYQDTTLAKLYARWGRQATYVGDWHTHPAGALTMSSTDRSTLRTIATSASARIAEPVMLICGGRRGWSFSAWHWCRRRPAWARRIHQIRHLRHFEDVTVPDWPIFESGN